jgi:hypothetical protein
LTDATATLKIEGGGLKTYSETRWTSMYEATSSVSRLRNALEHVSLLIFQLLLFKFKILTVVYIL